MNNTPKPQNPKTPKPHNFYFLFFIIRNENSVNSILKKKVKRSELVIDSLVRGLVFYFLDFDWRLVLFPLLLLFVI